MKNFIFMLVAALCLTLTSCSWFDSAPIEPQIIGVGHLQYDAVNKICFVRIGSDRYVVSSVTIPDHNPRTVSTTQSIKPFGGMLVTAFTSKHGSGIQAAPGKLSVQDIEALYRKNSALPFFLSLILGLCIIGIVYLPREGKVMI